ncbi:MAG TPA: sugar ABC transporter ATP-binding protein [Anaerolineaceae bacterium]|jgi:ribose transport system ATP-binding protein|nr:sugar ABC transporter ATP-binding protein [Anaerolineaceae bacterium]
MSGVSLSARNIVKRYGGVVALSDGNLDVHSGEVVALIGANGSGKSTMSKVINGVVVLDGGQLLLDGKPVRFSSPQAARKMGIATVFQELSLVSKMTVADNIWLTREPLKPNGMVDRKAMREKTEALLDLFSGTFKADLKPDTLVSALHPDEKQIVEILKAVSLNPRILILDEATASLDSRQVERLFELVKRWKEEGKAIVFVSHRMEEIFRIADRYSVLRNGKTVGEGHIKDITEKELIQLMTEKEKVFQFKKASVEEESSGLQQPVYLEIENLTTETLRGIDITVKQGELLGIGGLQGQGQRDLLLALFGDIPYQGTVRIKGEVVKFKHPRQAMKKKLALVPGDRAKEGLLYIRSILENFLLPSWQKYGFPLKMKHARRDALAVSERLSLVMSGLMAPVSSLSGGNAQKVVIGKWLLRDPDCYLLDDPTKGVDVHTKAEFYTLLTELSQQGKSILFYSSDDDELVGLCDRVIVLHDGKICAELKGASLTKENLIAASMGVSNGGEA